jgi:outer membrane protein TolC
MRDGKWHVVFSAAFAAASLGGVRVIQAGEAAPANAPAPAMAPPAVVHITLDEAKQRALANNKLLNLAALNAESKAFAVRAAKADYFPKVIGTDFYLHFNDDLGTVLTGGGRTVTGPRGRPLFTFPVASVNVPVLNQDTNVFTVGAIQPLTDLLKVRQGVKIAQADEQIARAQQEEGIRKLVSGVEQLYWGLLAARRIRAGAVESLQGAELLANKTKALEARTALVEARQGLQQVDAQIADVQAQLVALLDLPSCTTLDLEEPPLPLLPFQCAADVIGLALASSPDIREAEATVSKARAALTAGKLDFVPSIGLIGGYVNQTGASYIQQDIGYVGAVGSYTFVDWGKRRNVIRERQNLVAMATLKLEQTQDDVRQSAEKAFRNVAETQEALKTAGELVELRTEEEKKAATPEAMTKATGLKDLLDASKKLAEAEVDAVKADLAYREAYVKLMALLGK